MNIEVKRCRPEDLPVLKDLSVRIFRQTFEKDNTEENMRAFLEEAYNDEKLHDEIRNPESRFYILYVDAEDLNLDRTPAGYLKVNEGNAQSELQDPGALEIERLYVDSAFQGQKLGLFLINTAIQMAEMEGKDFVWLGVWEHNEKAKAFYTKRGFYKFGEHEFVMGDDHQIDELMRLDVDPDLKWDLSWR